MGLRALHDDLLAIMPEDASHDRETCQWCLDPELAEVTGGDMSDTTFTQEELDAAVSKAVDEATKSLKDEVADLRTDQEKAAVEARIAEVRSELEEKVEAAEAAKTEAEARATAAEEAREAVVTYLEGEKAAADAAAELAAKAEERKAVVKEIATFTDEELDAKATRWAEMADEDFDEYVEDLKATATKAVEAEKAAREEEAAKKRGGASLIPETAMSAERSADNGSVSAVKGVMALGRVAPDLSTL